MRITQISAALRTAARRRSFNPPYVAPAATAISPDKIDTPPANSEGIFKVDILA